MTPAAAFVSWLSGFGLSVFASSSVPSDQPFPYATFDLALGRWESGETVVTVDLWYYGDSEAVPNAKAEEIMDGLGIGGVTVPCDRGMLWIKRGSPAWQSVVDENDKVKRRYLNIDVEVLVP